MLAVEMLVAGLVVVLVAALARRAWVIGHREEGASISEAQAARERRALDNGDPGFGPSRARALVIPTKTHPRRGSIGRAEIGKCGTSPEMVRGCR